METIAKQGLSPWAGPGCFAGGYWEFVLDAGQGLRLTWTCRAGSRVLGTGPPQHLPTAALLTHGDQKVKTLLRSALGLYTLYLLTCGARTASSAGHVNAGTRAFCLLDQLFSHRLQLLGQE